MHLTRLHVLLIVVVLAVAGTLGRQPLLKRLSEFRSARVTPLSKRSEAPAQQPSNPAPRPVVAPPVSPVAQTAPAPASAPETSSLEAYRVSRGDTLWTIARDHSPVKAGAGWVGIWKANKKQISNFDRIEVGWTLTIPAEPKLYATRYWTPRRLDTAKLPGEVNVAELPLPREEGSVDLAELPILREVEWVDLAQLPVPDDSSLAEFIAAALPPPAPSLLSLHYR